jgi:molybdenum cofactor biosynthesis enzyme MoaA
MDDTLNSLTENVLPTSIGVELTSRCNLRCQYCSVPHAPSYGAEDLRPDYTAKALDLLRGEPLLAVALSGRGEISYAEHWPETIRRFQTLQVPTQLITNLAIPLTWEQACVLASIDSLGFSIDSLNRDLLRKVRKGADLRNIMANMAMLKAAAIHIGRPALAFDLFSVVTVSTVWGLEEVAAFAAAMGARQWHLQDLVMDYSELAEEVDVRHLSTLPADRLREAAGVIFRAKQVAEGKGVTVDIWPPFAQFLNGEASMETHAVEAPHLGRHLRHAMPLKPGETRDCFQPWVYMLLMANGGAEPCCGGYGAIGDYTDASTLADVANNENVRALRRQLLTGELSELCQTCSLRGGIPVAEFQAKIAQMMARTPPVDVDGATVILIKDYPDFSTLDPARPIVVYGTGRAGRVVYDAVHKHVGRAPDGYVSTNGGAPVEGVSHQSLAAFAASAPAGTQVVVASMYLQEIGPALLQHGISRFWNATPYITR